MAGLVVFKSHSGLTYIYDDYCGTTIPAPGTRPDHVPASALTLIQSLRSATRREWTTPPPWTPDEARLRSLSATNLQVTLIVTERCSLRCRYCVYSGTYENSRVHSSRDMPRHVARKAVDYLNERFREQRQYSPGTRLALGFYGGEPLLRFDLIQEAVHRAEQLELPCSFNVTTNGTIASPEIMTFLAEKRFNVAVSLDGPREEHDRNRIFADGRGSFDRVFSFVRSLEETRRRLDQAAASLMILCTYDKATDLVAVCRFFDEEPLLKGRAVVRCSGVYPYRTSYYDGWSEADLRRCGETTRALWPGYVEAVEAKADLKDIGFRASAFGLQLHSLTLALASPPNPSRGCCVPGSRLAVDPGGALHVCERVNGNYPLGDVWTGLDHRRVAELLNRFQEYLAGRCVGCNIKRICGACFAQAMTTGGETLEIPDEYCRETRLARRNSLGGMMTLLEKNPGWFEESVPSVLDLEMQQIFDG